MATEIELALMAGRAYQSTRKDINWFPVPDGWEEPLDERRILPSGFEAGYFQRGDEIVISYAGTYNKDLTGDIAADIWLATGFGSEQLLQAAEYYLQVKALNPNATITLTGHSLGGGLAALVGVFFGEKAVTFDQAPFAKSAKTGLLPPDVAADLLQYLQGQSYADADMIAVRDEAVSKLTNYLEQRELDGGIPNFELVTNLRVDGEFLSCLPLDIFFDPIGKPATVLDHGPYSHPSIDLHSMALLTAFLQSEHANPQQTLSEVSKELTDLLGMLFNSELYAASTDTETKNLLEHLIQHQEGLDPAVPNDGDAMLARFTSDLWKIAQDGGLTMSHEELTKALTAFAMQKYYEEPASGADHGQELFSEITGGIRFNRADVADNLDNAIGYNKYFIYYLATLPQDEREAILQKLPDLLDWYIQAGSEGMTAMAADMRAFMLGGDGVDYLTGGTQADVLVGNGGDDTLSGGAGADLMIGGEGIDTYFIEGNDTIQDSGRNFIVYDGQILAGGFVREEGTSVYRSLSDSNFTLTFDFAARLTVNGTDSVTFTQQTSAADFENGDFGIRLFDSVAADFTWNGGSLDTIMVVILDAADQPEYLYFFENGYAYYHIEYDYSLSLNFHIEGNGGNDILFGWAGSDYISGGAGHDRIVGDIPETTTGSGSGDILYGNEGSDYISGGWGDDLISGGADDDFLSGREDNDIVAGDGGNDLVLGGTGNDQLSGGAGNDILFGDGYIWDLPESEWDIPLPSTMGFQMTYDAKGFPVDFSFAYQVGNASIGYGDDFLAGGDGNDWLDGGGGNDSLVGGVGNDYLVGGRGNDILMGETEHDTMVGGNDDDYLDGGDGNDLLIGDNGDGSGTGNDILYGSGGEDQLQGGYGDDLLDGGNDDDILLGEEGDDTLLGGAGNDSLYGNAGNDVLDGGIGNDLLVGGAGNEVYLFGRGGGQDTINDSGGAADIIRFADISSGEVTVTRDQGNIYLTIGETGDRLSIENWFADNSYKIERLEFADGIVWNTAMLESKITVPPATDTRDVLYASDKGSVINGLGGDDDLIGGLGKDWLYGGAGADLLMGNAGNDNLVGGDGNDTYTFYRGFGRDTILEMFADGDVDTIFFGGDIAPANVSISTDNSNLYLSITGTADVLILSRWFTYDWRQSPCGVSDYSWVEYSSLEAVEQVRFSDGTVWNADYLRSHTSYLPGVDANKWDGYLWGSMGDDTLYGGAESDIIYGVHGDDYISGGADDDMLYGGPGNDWLVGGEGYDFLLGEDGNDVLDPGAGGGSLIGGAGNDVYLFGAGSGETHVYDYDTTPGNVDTVRIAAGVMPDDVTVSRDFYWNDYLYLTLDNGADRLDLYNWMKGDAYMVERVEFADGTVWDAATIHAKANTPTEAADGLDGFGDDHDDVFDGLGGADWIYGHGGNDIISGGAGNDLLEGQDGNDVLDGGTGADELKGGKGDDILDGGVDNRDNGYWYNWYVRNDTDYLNGGAGNDVYLFGPGSGKDVVGEWDNTPGNVDTVRMTAGVAPGDVTVTSDGTNLYLSLNNGTDRMTLANWFTSDNSKIEQVEFADGTVWDAATLLANVQEESKDLLNGTAGDDIINGSEGNDSIYGWGGNDTLIGEAGNDYLSGGDGNDTLDGGTGDDILNGHAGDDVYLFGPGYGRDSVSEYDASPGNVDTVRMADGVEPSDVTVTRDQYNNLYLSLNDGADRLSVQGWFYGSAQRIEQVVFADGTVWDAATLEGLVSYAPTEGADYLTGTSGNDTFDGLGGSDLIFGGLGDDTYVFGRGSGMDTIWDWNNYGLTPANADCIQLGPDVAPNDLLVTSDRDNLYLSISGTADQLTVANWGYGDGFKIERVQFVDGTVWDISTLEGNITPLSATERDDVIFGGQADEVFVGLAGNDRIMGEAGNDMIEGGAGEDNIQGGAGNDLLRGGDGNDDLNDGDGFNLLDGGAAHDYLYSGGSANFVIGGTGDDWIDNDAANSVIAFNRGDGKDIVFVYGSFTLSLGEEIQAAELVLSKNDEDDFLLQTGGGDSLIIVFEDWYRNGRPIVTLQSIDDQVRWYDLTAVMDEFARRQQSEANFASWNLGSALTDYSLGASTDRAYGGDLAYRYALGGSRALPSDESIRQILADADFGLQSQLFTPGYNVVITGTAGDDTLTGEAGNDTLQGGPGNDLLIGGDGDDTYLFNPGDGVDRIMDSGGTDTIEFGAGITPDSLSFGLGSLLVRVGDQGEAIHLEGFNPDDPLNSSVIETFRFADGTALGIGDLLARGFDIQGSSGDDLLTGTAATDRITGGEGADTLSGGKGDDLLSGGSGSDTYVFNSGDGVDTIVDISSATEGNLIEFGAGITAGDLIFERDGGDLLIRVGSQGDILRLRDFDRFGNNGSLVADTLQFADSSQASLFQLTNTAPVVGVMLQDQTATEDAAFSFTIPADAFTDVDAGDSLAYTASLSDGSALPSWLNFDAANRTFSGTPDSISAGLWGVRVTAMDKAGAWASDDFILDVANHLAGAKSDGSLSGTYLRDVIEGTAGDNILLGYEGNDYLAGGTGDDTLIGGVGDDILDGGEGDDTYIFNPGDGEDTISYCDIKGFDTISFGADIGQSGVGLFRNGNNLEIGYSDIDKVSVSNFFSGTGYQVDEVNLADGSCLTAADINQIIQDMAAYAVNEGIALTSVNDVRNNEQLMSIVANSWHA